MVAVRTIRTYSNPTVNHTRGNALVGHIDDRKANKQPSKLYCMQCLLQTRKSDLYSLRLLLLGLLALQCFVLQCVVRQKLLIRCCKRLAGLYVLD